MPGKKKNVLTLHMMTQKLSNRFCPHCGVVVPPETKCIPSPTHEDVQYHVNCFYAMAQRLGCRLEVA